MVAATVTKLKTQKDLMESAKVDINHETITAERATSRASWRWVRWMEEDGYTITHPPKAKGGRWVATVSKNYVRGNTENVMLLLNKALKMSGLGLVKLRNTPANLGRLPEIALAEAMNKILNEGV